MEIPWLVYSAGLTLEETSSGETNIFHMTDHYCMACNSYSSKTKKIFAKILDGIYCNII